MADEGDAGDDEVVDVEELYYPTMQEIIQIHDDVIEEDPNAEPGIRDRGKIEYILDHIQFGSFGGGPETLHEKGFQLMRLLAANHAFVDGNKRTALASAVVFYFWNGYELEYQEELEAMLILISIREDFIDPDVAVEYLDDIIEPWDVEALLEELFGPYTDVFIGMAESME